MKSRIYPVIMSGGAGSRLWPLSRQAEPKQLLPLVTDQTMIQATVARFDGPEFADPVFICNALHVDQIKAQMSAMSRSVDAIIVEPVGRNTAPCAVVAAQHVKSRDPDALVLLVPADHHVEKPKNFAKAVHRAVPAARDGRLVTFGITPEGPETGYGYIEGAEALDDGVFAVEAFREKPNRETAEAYLKTGRYSWNAGLFLFSPDAFLSEAQVHADGITKSASAAYDKATWSADVAQLDQDIFAACASDSIDYAVMEKTQKAAVVPVDMGWSDIGSFSALHEVRQNGEDRNALTGDVILQNAAGILAHSDGPTISVVGLNNIGVIVRDGNVLVVGLDSAQDVKKVVTHLKDKGRTDKL